MENGPVLKIDGKRYRARRLKFGAYREIMMILDEIETLDPEEFRESMVDAIRTGFELTEEQADQIDTADIFPTFNKLAKWAHQVFLGKVNSLPNANSPADLASETAPTSS